MPKYLEENPEFIRWLSAEVYPPNRVLFITLERMPVFKKHNAISLGFVVLLRKSKFKPFDLTNDRMVETVIHELIHIRQQQKTLILPWFVAYLLLWIGTGFSYRKNPLESVAFREGAELLQNYRAEESSR